MCNVIDLREWRRTRLGGGREPPIYRRARPKRRREEDGSFIRIGDVSAGIVRKLRE